MSASDRPLLHFTARDGWINDPHGITWHGGRYHLFFQHVPGSATWALACRWGHAISDDLVDWTELPVALEPGDGDDGVWSGALAMDDDGTARVFYTSVQGPDTGIGRIRVAEPVDADWVRWRKGEAVVAAPPELDVRMFRDPVVTRAPEGWRMLVGASVAAADDAAGAALGFVSPDLRSWRFDGVVAGRAAEIGDGVWTGEGWECPQIVEVDGSTVLVVSAWEPAGGRHVAAAVGDLVDGRFTARRWSRIGWGAEFAASVFRDRDGRPCLMSWIRGARGDGWAGALTVPQLLRVEHDRLVLAPHPAVVEAAAARGRPIVSPTAAGVVGPLRIERDAEVLVVRDGDRELGRVPAGDRAPRVLVDGPVVEVWTSAGVLASGRLQPP